jgi:hypothetical protein
MADELAVLIARIESEGTEKTKREFKEVAQAGGKVEDQVKKTETATRRLDASLDALVQALNSNTQAAQALDASLGRTRAETERLVGATTAATRSTRDLTTAQRTTNTTLEQVIQSLSGVRSGTDAAAGSTRGLTQDVGAMGLGVSVADVAMQAFRLALDTMKYAMESASAATDFGAQAQVDYTNIIVRADEAVRGLTISTYKLADARRAAAVAEIDAATTKNSEQIGKLQTFDFRAFAGYALLGSATGLGGQLNSAAERQRREEIERLKNINAGLGAAGNEQFFGPQSQYDTNQQLAASQKEINSALDSALPKEAGLARIQTERTKIQAGLAAGTIDAAKAQRALNALDAEQAKLLAGPKATSGGGGGRAAGLSEAEKAARAAAQALKQAQAETAKYITGLEQEAKAAGLSAQAAERLNDALQIEAALRRGDVDSAVKIHDLRLEIESREVLGKELASVTEHTKALEKANKDLMLTVQPSDLKAVADGIEDWSHSLDAAISKAQRLADTFTDVGGSIEGMFYSFKSGNLSGMVRDFDTLKTTISGLKGGSFADKTSAGFGVASAAGNLIGGKVGGGISTGASAGQLALLLGASGPAAIAVAAVAALASLASAFQKPSNQGAGLNLVSGEFSGKSRTSETEAAVRQAGDAIKQAEEALKGYGLTLKETINGLVIGSRDQSQIYTSGGKTILAAKGDPQAAVEAALNAVLDGADFVSDAQRKLVDDMQAAGKGFDDIATTLQAFQAAQGFLTSVTDEIQRLTDPKAYDITQLTRAQEARDKEIKGAADAGLLTASQFDEVSTQLVKLKGLELDGVMKRYSDSVEDATRGNELLLQIAESGVSTALSDLQAAYEAAAAPIRQTISEFESLADTIRQFNDASRLDALSPTGLRKEFDRVGSLAAQGDKAALGAFTSVASAYRDSIAKTAPDALTAAKENARIRRVSEDALKATESQIDLQKAQLDVLEDKVAPYLDDIRKTAKSIDEAIRALLSARDFQRAQQFKTDANGLLQLGGAPSPTAAADQAWYDSLGDSGLLSLLGRPPGFASGGMHPGGLRIVGEDGPEVEATGPSRIWNARQIASAVGGGGTNTAALEAEVRQLRVDLKSALDRIDKSTRKTADLLTNVTRDGEALLTEAA